VERALDLALEHVEKRRFGTTTKPRSPGLSPRRAQSKHKTSAQHTSQRADRRQSRERGLSRQIFREYLGAGSFSISLRAAAANVGEVERGVLRYLLDALFFSR